MNVYHNVTINGLVSVNGGIPGGQFRVHAGTLTVANGGNLMINGGTVSVYAAAGSIVIAAGGQINQSAGSGASLSALNGGTLRVTSGGTLQSGGQITVRGPFIIEPGATCRLGSFPVPGAVVVYSGGTLVGEVTFEAGCDSYVSFYDGGRCKPSRRERGFGGNILDLSGCYGFDQPNLIG